jgi:xanthine dehydrogenase iron-sulfur cluster and FAD-binding subunit A
MCPGLGSFLSTEAIGQADLCTSLMGDIGPMAQLVYLSLNACIIVEALSSTPRALFSLRAVFKQWLKPINDETCNGQVVH